MIWLDLYLLKKQLWLAFHDRKPSLCMHEAFTVCMPLFWSLFHATQVILKFAHHVLFPCFWETLRSVYIDFLIQVSIEKHSLYVQFLKVELFLAVICIVNLKYWASRLEEIFQCNQLNLFAKIIWKLVRPCIFWIHRDHSSPNTLICCEVHYFP